MITKRSLLRLYVPLGVSLLSLCIVLGLVIYKEDAFGVGSILGKTTTAATTPTPTQRVHFDTIISPLLPTQELSQATNPTPTIASNVPPETNYDIVLVNWPGELKEGNPATFTWYVSGSPGTIHTSTIYFGTTSTPGNLSEDTSPAQTRYTDFVKDFMQGDYIVPIRFVGNSSPLKQGTYYYRAYTVINGKHYWTEERLFIVNPLPLNAVSIVSYPTTVDRAVNSTATFTWEITGPTNTTNFTAVVAGRESKPGILDTSVDLPKTPYSLLVKDFISGTYSIPIRLIGNASMFESGIYYFRVLTFINGKNIWSEEHSLTVQ